MAVAKLRTMEMPRAWVWRTSPPGSSAANGNLRETGWMRQVNFSGLPKRAGWHDNLSPFRAKPILGLTPDFKPGQPKPAQLNSSQPPKTCLRIRLREARHLRSRAGVRRGHRDATNRQSARPEVRGPAPDSTQKPWQASLCVAVSLLENWRRGPVSRRIREDDL
jgi:hypothetical protein